MSQISEETKMIIASNLVVASELRAIYWILRKPSEPSPEQEKEYIIGQLKNFRSQIK